MCEVCLLSGAPEFLSVSGQEVKKEGPRLEGHGTCQRSKVSTGRGSSAGPKLLQQR